MIVHSYYDEDPRVRREAETLVAAGHPVHVIGLRRLGEPAGGELGGVVVHRVDVQRHQGAGLWTYLREYVAFALGAARWAWRLHRRERFGVVQIHSLPDWLVLAALPLKAQGVPVVLDLHEVMPELFRGRFPRAANPVTAWLLRLQERWSIGLADVVLSVNQPRRSRLVGLGFRPDKLEVVENTPSLARFDPAPHPIRPFRADGSLRLVYAGGLTPTYELDVVVRAVARLADQRPDLDARLELYGRGDSETPLRALADSFGVAERVTFHGRIPLDEVPAALAAADIGVAPTRRDPFTDMSMSTKIHEYAAMGRPVVATWLPLIAETFSDGSVATYPSGDEAALATEIAALADDPDRRARAVTAAERVVRATAWEHEGTAYVALIERLAARDAPATQATPSRR
jgi:glycosyltransferase involved in cell wall biosynthesis